jgi:hypothetical protein
MKRTSAFLIGIFLLVMLSVGVISADGRFPPKGPLALIHEQIGLLVDALDELRLEIDVQQDLLDSQQEQICALYKDSDLPLPLECPVIRPPPCPEPPCDVCGPSACKTGICPCGL